MFKYIALLTAAATASRFRDVILGPTGNPLHTTDAVVVCEQIENAISSESDVYWPPEENYLDDIEHYASSSTEFSVCSVEPGTAEDVGEILKILGSSRTPFAVKGGGHIANPRFSSTTGVHISMTRFNQIVYDSASGTAVIGSGLVWDDVYSALAPYDVNVVGGRVTGVGVAGFTLGGGYSWLTNQYGLTIDTMKAYELVLPNGTVTEVTNSTNSDLFFALKGGFNNFGIVTKFTLKTFPQGQVWGGLITYLGDKFEALELATSNFVTNNSDPKAAIIAEFNALASLPGVTLSIFYDGPTVPDGIFDEFLAIDSFTSDVSTRSFLSLVKSAPSDTTAGLRGAFNTVSLTGVSVNLMKVIANETLFWGSKWVSTLPGGIFLSYDVESFASDIFTHGSDSAYPPDRSRGLMPLNIYYAWNVKAEDSEFIDAIKTSAATITAAASAEGQNVGDATLYGNYAVGDTPLSRIYGNNLPRLQSIKATYDPQNVMGLAGGWKIEPKGSVTNPRKNLLRPLADYALTCMSLIPGLRQPMFYH